MNKKSGILFVVFGLMLISFVSAYGAIDDTIDRLGGIETIVLVLLGIIFFAVIYYSLMRTWKNQMISAVISACISILIILAIHWYGFDFDSLLFNIGFSSEMLYVVLPIILLIACAILLIKFGRWFLLISGIGMIVSAFSDYLVFEKGLVVVLGIVFVLGALALWYWRPQKKKEFTFGYS